MFSGLFISLTTFSALTSVVYAQFTTSFSYAASTTTTALPTSPAQETPCLRACIETAATAAGCQNITDFGCFCASSEYQSVITRCLSTYCTAADVQTALGLQLAECANPGTTTTTTDSTTPAASESSSSTGPPLLAPDKATTPSNSSNSSNSNSNSGSNSSSNATTNPPPTSSTSAGFAPQFALSVSYIIGLAGAVVVGVITGSSSLLL